MLSDLISEELCHALYDSNESKLSDLEELLSYVQSQIEDLKEEMKEDEDDA